MTVTRLTPDEAAARREELVDLLLDAVDHGASVNFVQPLTRGAAASWWAGALASHARGERVILAAVEEGRLLGSVQLVPAPQENQPFRADVGKLIVHSAARRRGLGAALMRAVEKEARRADRVLLTLDTETGCPADRLYRRLGWTCFGVVPGYALTADGRTRADCSFFYKSLA